MQDSAVVQDMKQCTDTPVTSYFIHACHGQKHCNLTANPLALEVDMCSALYVYLKTVYACVDMQAIQDTFVDRTTQQRHIQPTVLLTTANPSEILKATPNTADILSQSTSTDNSPTSPSKKLRN